MKKGIALLIVCLMTLTALGGTALGESALSYEGQVVAGDTLPIVVPFGGRVDTLNVRVGSWVREGEVIGTLQTTLNYAPVEGTVTGLYAQEGDTTESVAERYGAVLYIEPTHRYVLQATAEKAFNSSENKYIHLGEKVYMTCVSDGSHKGTGIVTALTDSGYNIEVTGGEFYMGEKVDIFRDEANTKESRIGRGIVNRNKPVAVKGSGSVVKLHVANGDFVERGEVLFETAEGTLDGLYAPGRDIISPVTGVVASVEKNRGDSLGKGDALVKVIPADSFRVQFDVPEEDVFTLTEGQNLTMELYWDNAGGTYTGKILSISHMSEEQKTETDKKVFRAFASMEPDERVRLGMTVILYPAEAESQEAEEAMPEATEAPETEEEKAE